MGLEATPVLMEEMVVVVAVAIRVVAQAQQVKVTMGITVVQPLTVAEEQVRLEVLAAQLHLGVTVSGGNGTANNITGSNVTRAAGGSANSSSAGGANTGNGGGSSGVSRGAGGSGIVIFRYITGEATNKGITVSGGASSASGVYTVLSFTSSGTLTLS